MKWNLNLQKASKMVWFTETQMSWSTSKNEKVGF